MCPAIEIIVASSTYTHTYDVCGRCEERGEDAGESDSEDARRECVRRPIDIVTRIEKPSYDPYKASHSDGDGWTEW